MQEALHETKNFEPGFTEFLATVVVVNRLVASDSTHALCNPR